MDVPKPRGSYTCKRFSHCSGLSCSEPVIKRIKHRIPRQNPVVIDVARPGEDNNGNIEIFDLGASSTHDKFTVDEVFINGKRYRVPERIIKLDFWDRVHTLHCPTQRCVLICSQH